MSGRLALLACVVVPLLGGCERGMHDMYQQPKDGPGSPSRLFADGSAERPPVAGTVVHSRGEAAETTGGRRGGDRPPPATVNGAVVRAVDAPARPPAVTLALLQRGRQRYDIYCAACHGLDGRGDGMVVKRGFPAPPTYHSPRLRRAPDSHFYDVISDGYGVMYPYADRIDPADRWAIVAYVRALQLSRHVLPGHLPAQDRAVLERVGADTGARP